MSTKRTKDPPAFPCRPKAAETSPLSPTAIADCDNCYTTRPSLLHALTHPTKDHIACRSLDLDLDFINGPPEWSISACRKSLFIRAMNIFGPSTRPSIVDLYTLPPSAKMLRAGAMTPIIFHWPTRKRHHAHPLFARDEAGPGRGDPCQSEIPARLSRE